MNRWQGGDVRHRRERAQGLVEFALILPILVVIVLGIINLAYVFFVHTSLVGAAHEGVRYGIVEPRDAAGICDRVVSHGFLTALELERITVTYDDLGVTFQCDEPESHVDGDDITPGDHRLSVRVEHDLPPLTPIIPTVFHIDVVARRTITSRGS